jgi:hypothetical protein
VRPACFSNKNGFLSATVSVSAEMLRKSVILWSMTMHEQRRVAGRIEDIMTLRMTEAELARDVHAVLEKVRQGVESSSNRAIDPWPCSKPTKATGERSRT